MFNRQLQRVNDWKQKGQSTGPFAWEETWALSCPRDAAVR
jgi:hypothetical protein